MRRLGACLLAVSIAGSSLAGAAEPASGEPPILQRGAVSGVRQRISFFAQVNPDCSSAGLPAIHILLPPQHGTLQAITAPDYTSFAAGSQDYGCNLHKTIGTMVVYFGRPGFQGTDILVISVIYPDGYRNVLRYSMTVESADSVSVNRDGWQHV